MNPTLLRPVLPILLAAGLLAVGLLTACGPRKPVENPPDKLGYAALYEEMRREESALAESRNREREMERRAEPQPGRPAGLAPVYNPLDETQISISVQDESLRNVLYLVARNAGLNLVLEPEVDGEARVTASFVKTRSSLVTERILGAFDLAWKVEGNVLSVSRFEERLFDLGFVNAKSEVELSNGGDIFGSSMSERSGSLRGDFQVRSSIGPGLDKGTLYAQLRDSVHAVLTRRSQADGQSGAGVRSAERDAEGHFALDPVAGTLYVRSSPRRVRAVSALIDRLKAKLSRQVQIDARIIEVRLKDEFNLGIDWNFVLESVYGGRGLSVNLGFNGGSGGSIPISIGTSSITPIERLTSFTATIDALRKFGGVRLVSNPHVRAGHGQAALFTSGTSQNYVRGIKRQDTERTTNYSVEVAQVFDGVMLGVVPFIGEDGVVDLRIFPIKSAVDASSLTLQDVTGSGDRITLPKIDVRNVSTGARARNGDTLILGGLIDRTNDNTDSAVPGLGGLPALGGLFRKESKTESVRELVVVMHIRVLE